MQVASTQAGVGGCHCLIIVSQATKLPQVIREDLSRNFGYLVNDVARLMRTVYDRRVRKLGPDALAVVGAEPHLPASRRDAVGARRDPGDRARHARRLLDRLEAKRWVRREHDARDRRAWRVHLTAAAEPAMRKLRQQALACGATRSPG